MLDINLHVTHKRDTIVQNNENDPITEKTRSSIQNRVLYNKLTKATKATIGAVSDMPLNSLTE